MNVRLFFIFIFNLISSCTINAQPPLILWERTIGGTYLDQGNQIQIDTNKSYSVFGTTSSIDGDVIGNHGSKDAWILQIDSNQDIVSQKCFGGISVETSISGAIINEGYILVGDANFEDGDVIGIHNNSNDIWVVKSNSLMNLEWQKCLGTSGSDYSKKIICTSDGGYLITGQLGGFGGNTSCNLGLQNLWIIKLDSLGIIIWEKCIGSNEYDNAGSIIQLLDGNFLVFGGVAAHNGSVTCSDLGSTWLIKIDTSGNVIWDKCFDGEVGVDMKERPNGNLVLTCGHHNPLVSGYAGARDIWIYETDSLGNILYSKSFGGSWLEEPHSITLSSDGGVIIAGETESSDGLAIGNHGGKDAFIIKLDSLFNLEWAQCYGGSGDDLANSIVEDVDGKFVFTGTTNSNDGDINSNPHGDYDLWLVKLATPSNYIKEIQNSLSEVKFTYNHESLNIKLTSKFNSIYHLIIFDVIGKIISNEKISVYPGHNNIVIPVQLSNGLKLASFRNDFFTADYKIIVQ